MLAGRRGSAVTANRDVTTRFSHVAPAGRRDLPDRHVSAVGHDRHGDVRRARSTTATASSARDGDRRRACRRARRRRRSISSSMPTGAVHADSRRRRGRERHGGHERRGAASVAAPAARARARPGSGGSAGAGGTGGVVGGTAGSSGAGGMTAGTAGRGGTTGSGGVGGVGGMTAGTAGRGGTTGSGGVGGMTAGTAGRGGTTGAARRRRHAGHGRIWRRGRRRRSGRRRGARRSRRHGRRRRRRRRRRCRRRVGVGGGGGGTGVGGAVGVGGGGGGTGCGATICAPPYICNGSGACVCSETSAQACARAGIACGYITDNCGQQVFCACKIVGQMCDAVNNVCMSGCMTGTGGIITAADHLSELASDLDRTRYRALGRAFRVRIRAMTAKAALFVVLAAVGGRVLPLLVPRTRARSGAAGRRWCSWRSAR